jgi:hypothetical protein
MLRDLLKMLGSCEMHCPKTHEKFPSSFGNAGVISSDRRKLFINIFPKTTWKIRRVTLKTTV